MFSLEFQLPKYGSIINVSQSLLYQTLMIPSCELKGCQGWEISFRVFDHDPGDARGWQAGEGLLRIAGAEWMREKGCRNLEDTISRTATCWKELGNSHPPDQLHASATADIVVLRFSNNRPSIGDDLILEVRKFRESGTTFVSTWSGSELHDWKYKLSRISISKDQIYGENGRFMVEDYRITVPRLVRWIGWSSSVGDSLEVQILGNRTRRSMKLPVRDLPLPFVARLGAESLLCELTAHPFKG